MASIKDLKRMCRNHEECNGCPLFSNGFSQCIPNEFPDNVDFLTKLPNAPQMDRDKIPKVCRSLIYGGICPKQCNIVSSCVDCWNMEIGE